MSATLDPALAGEFVLGLLEGAEQHAAVRACETDPAFHLAVIGWRERFLALDLAAVPMQPSPELLDRVLASATPETSGTATRRGGGGSTVARPSMLERLWNSLALWRPVGLTGALASLVLAVLMAGREVPEPVLPRVVAVMNTPEGKPAAIVNAYSDGTVQLVPLDPVAAPEGRVLEVWTLQTRERGPVSIARIDKARTIKLDLKGLSPAQVGHIFEITLEPAGGSPTGRPTGPVLMKGLASTRL
jgi:anti-sigma-K factor RskA